MDIKSPNHEYFVIKTVLCSECQDIYVCRNTDTDTDSHGLFTINILKNKELVKTFLPMFSDLLKRGDMKDFIDLFAKDSCLYLVFNYYTESKLFSVISHQIISFSEKKEAAKSLLLSLISLKVPLGIQFCILEDINLNLNSSFRIYFNYFLDIKNVKNKLSARDLIKKTGSLLKRIFSSDKSQMSPEIKSIIQNCLDNKFDSLIDVYLSLKDYAELRESGSEILSAKQSLIRKLLNNKKRFQTAAIIILIGGIAAFAAYNSFFKTSQVFSQNNSYNGITRIGTIELVPDVTPDGSTSNDGRD